MVTVAERLKINALLILPVQLITCSKFQSLKTVLLFGAGKSATALIDYLLKEASSNNWKIIVTDADRKLIEEKTNNHPSAEISVIDVTNRKARIGLIERADLVISMMPPSLHILIAKDCLEKRKHLLTASYADDEMKALDKDATKQNVLMLCEMGLDPGIDHMSAMQLLHKIKAHGGTIHSFKSHCGGLVAPENDDNPWKYKISWNPRNIVLAGKAGAMYKYDGEIKDEKYENLFDAKRVVNTGLQEIGVLSYYPNRNSLPYIDLYDLQDADTFVRTTLRYPDFMYGWKNVIDLKLTDETAMYDTDGKSLQDFFKEHMYKNGFGEWLEQKLSENFTQTKSLLDNLMKLMEAEQEVAEVGEEVPENFLMVDESGELKHIEYEEIKNSAASTMANKMHEANLTLKQLFYLGMDDNATLINKGVCSAADILQFSLEKKLALGPGEKDMIIMLHEIEYSIDGVKKLVKSTLLVKGEDHIHTAMAKTVGLPLGIAAKLILNGAITETGVRIPVSEEIYTPVMNELSNAGIRFTETISDI